MNPLLNKILWKDKRGKLTNAAILGCFIGFLLLLGALQLVCDLRDLLYSKNPNDTQYVVITKKVSLFNTLGTKAAFKMGEVEKLKTSELVADVGRFTSNKFIVSASSEMLGFYTDFFFESVPEKFLDVQPGKWQWTKGQKEIPIILSKDYLALYNFGFAPSQGLPQFTANTIKKVPLDITINGNGLKQIYRGRIVGFTDRLNSILVPQNFMEWANQTYGNDGSNRISRLVLETTNPYSKELKAFLDGQGYEISSGRIIGGKVINILETSILGLGIIGLVILLLSLLIFLLNFQLIISRSKEDISLLAQLGFKQKQISDMLFKKLSWIYLSIFILCIVLLYVLHYPFSSWLNQQGFEMSKHLNWMVWAFALVFSLSVLFFQRKSIGRNVARLYQ